MCGGGGQALGKVSTAGNGPQQGKVCLGKINKSVCKVLKEGWVEAHTAQGWATRTK